MIRSRLNFLLAIFLLAALFSPSPNVDAQRSVASQCYDHQTITVSTSAVALDATKLLAGPGQYAAVAVECSSASPCPIRVWVDGTAPTSSTGLQYPTGSTFAVYELPNLQHFKGIRSGANDAVIQVQLCKYLNTPGIR